MIEFRVSATVPFEAKYYWDHVRESVDFLSFLCAETSDLKSIEEVSRSAEGAETVVVVRTVPRTALGVFKKLLGGSPLEFLDTHRRKTDRAEEDPLESHFVTTPPVLKSKIDIRGRLSVVPTGPSACMQVLEGTVSVVGVLGLNGIISKAVVEGIQKTYTALPAVLSKYKKQNGPRLQADAERIATAERAANVNKVEMVERTLKIERDRARAASARASVPRLSLPAARSARKGGAAADSDDDDSFYSAKAWDDDDDLPALPVNKFSNEKSTDDKENRFGRAAAILSPVTARRRRFQ